jgi:membrane protein
LSTATDEQTRVGRAPSGPQKLSRRDWIAVFKRAAKEFVSDDCIGLSQAIAYSSMLAFFPAVIFLLGLLGTFHLYTSFESFVATVAPHGVIKFIDGLQKDSHGGAGVTAFVIGFFGAIWAASGAMGTVTKAVNRAYERPETRPFWKVRLIAIVLVALNGLVLAGLVILIVFGGPLGDAIASKAGLGGAFKVVWNVLRWPMTFGAVLLFFAFVYYLGPNKEQRNWKWITPGSLVGSLLWLALSGLFALYVTFAGSYSKTYGTLASGVILLLWLNYSAFALLFGAELNSELDRQADIRAAGGPDAGLIQPARRARTR